VLVGASCDSPEAQKKFKEKHNLPYTLLSDPEGKLAAAFGFGPRQRKTAVVDKEGRLEKVCATVTAPTHAKDLLKELAGGK